MGNIAPAFVHMKSKLEPREGQGRGYVEPARLEECTGVRACARVAIVMRVMARSVAPRAVQP